MATATAGREVEVDTRRRAKDIDNDENPTNDDDEDDDEAPEDEEDSEESEDADAEPDDDADEGDEDADEDADEDEGDADPDAEGEEEEPEDDEEEREPAKHALNSKAEFRKLQNKFKDNPEGLQRELHKTFTQKTQEISAERKSYKALLSYLPLIQLWEQNPQQALKRMGALHGYRIVADDDATDETAPLRSKGGKTKAAADDDPAETKTFIDGIVKDFKESLGPELEYMGDAIAPAMVKAMQAVADRAAGGRFKSLEEATSTALRGNAEIESDRILDSFKSKHTDYDTYEEEMGELAQTLMGDGSTKIPMTEAQFLSFLYDTVKNKRIAAGAPQDTDKEARKLMKKRLKKIATARSGDRRPARSAPEEQIRRRPKGGVSIRQAFKAAVAGVRYDDDGEDDDD